MSVPLSTVDSRSTLASSGNASSVWTKPRTSGYSFSGLFEFPRRVISPPPAGLPMLATVGSLTLRPSYDVKIEDMLAAKYLPPLGLRDFEEWLLFTEHSAENLYFVQWLKEYTDRYENGTWSDSQLWFSFLRAKASFFNPQGSLELNLPHAITRDVSAITFSTPYSADASAIFPKSVMLSPTSTTSTAFSMGDVPVGRAPSPDQLDAAKDHVMKMLTVSLHKFASDCTSNAGVARRFYCASVGIATCLIALSLVVLSIIRDYSRYIRLISFPLFWSGGIVMICAYAKICLVIYLWGDFRQLRGYELDMPAISSIQLTEKRIVDEKPSYPPQATVLQYAPSNVSHSTLDPEDLKVHDEDGQDLEFPMPKNDIESVDTVSPAITLFLPSRPRAGIDGDSESTPASIPTPRRAPPVLANLPRSPASPYGFDWDAPTLTANADTRQQTKKTLSPTSIFFASSSSSSSRSSSPTLAQMNEKVRPIFAPLTKVINPLIVRGMAEIVRRSTFWGLVFGIVMTAICLILPAKGHSWNEGW